MFLLCVYFTDSNRLFQRAPEDILDFFYLFFYKDIWQ